MINDIKSFYMCITKKFHREYCAINKDINYMYKVLSEMIKISQSIEYVLKDNTSSDDLQKLKCSIYQIDLNNISKIVKLLNIKEKLNINKTTVSEFNNTLKNIICMRNWVVNDCFHELHGKTFDKSVNEIFLKYIMKLIKQSCLDIFTKNDYNKSISNTRLSFSENYINDNNTSNIDLNSRFYFTNLKIAMAKVIINEFLQCINDNKTNLFCDVLPTQNITSKLVKSFFVNISSPQSKILLG